MISGGVVTDAIGKKHVSGAIIRTRSGEEVKLDCDLIAVSGGWNPNIQLTTHLGGKPVWNDELSTFTPGVLPAGMSVAGSAGGTFGLRSALEAGSAAGSTAATASGFKAAATSVPRAKDEGVSISPLWRVRATRGKAFVDQQNDVTASDIELSEREGFRSVEHSEAIYDPWHGDRPGQDCQRQRSRDHGRADKEVDSGNRNDDG